MEYAEIKRKVDRHIARVSEDFPQNAFAIAKALDLRLKNSIECKQDYQEQYPLYNTNAILTRFFGEYTIYYDENHAYRNFFIAHEIAHYILGHESEGMSNDHDAQIAAAIIVAPVELVHKNHVKSAIQLSEQCKIPINIAVLYLDEIRPQTKFSAMSAIGKPIGIAVMIIAVIVGAIKFSTLQANFPPITATEAPIQRINPDTYPTTIPVEQNASDRLQCVYITQSGRKYHTANCRHIRGSEVTELSVEEAVALGKEPCADCIK